MKDFVTHIEKILTEATGMPCTAFNIGKWYLYVNVPINASEKAKEIVLLAYPFKSCTEEDRKWHKGYTTLRFSVNTPKNPM